MATYIVVKGDTFDTIAQRLGVTEADLKKANPNITNINQLTPGEKVHVPGDAPNTTYHVKSGDTGQSMYVYHCATG
jgi:LysM repeat protein